MMERQDAMLCELALERFSLGDAEGSLDAYRRLLSSPALGRRERAIVHGNVGSVLMSTGRHREAAAEIALSLSMHPSIETVWNHSLCLLHLGRLEEGLSLYRARYGGRDASDAVSFPDLPIPQATSREMLAGGRVLVLNEQGFGDEMMFSRGLRLLNEASGGMVQCYPETRRLLESLHPGLTFFTDRSMSYGFVAGFDVWTCTGDLFSWCSPTDAGSVPSFPSRTPSRGRERDTIAICLGCNRRSGNASSRSLPHDEIVPRIAESGARMVCVQKDADYGHGDVVDYGRIRECSDFLDTGRLISGLDGILTCDTAIAHLAGVLSLEATVVLGDNPDWRWKYRLPGNPDRSAFYPSITLKKFTPNQ